MNGQAHEGTELSDLAGEEPTPPTAYLTFVRDARLFARDRSLHHRFGAEREVVILAPDELFRPPLPADVAVRLGKLRVSEFLPDGREVTRVVLQAGAILRTRSAKDDAQREGYDLARIVLMALDQAELWLLPAESLDLRKP